MDDEQIDEAIETLARACNVERRQAVTQALRRIVNSGGEIAASASAEPVVQVSIRDGFIVGGINYGLAEGKHELFAAHPAPSGADAAPAIEAPAQAVALSAEPFPYQQTFDAIAFATKIEGGGISISVEKFRKAFASLASSAQASPAAPSSAEKLRRDAQRYRWLRLAKYEEAIRALFDFKGTIPLIPWRNAREQLDAAIDAAIASQSAKEPRGQ